VEVQYRLQLEKYIPNLFLKPFRKCLARALKVMLEIAQLSKLETKTNAGDRSFHRRDCANVRTCDRSSTTPFCKLHQTFKASQGPFYER
jgi:hypothetical protein